MIESVQRIEPALLEPPSTHIVDVMAELVTATTTLETALHPRTGRSLADLVRIMNTYYSNLIEGHNTRPKDIKRALEGQFDQNITRRSLQIEAAAHVHIQADIDQMAAENKLSEPASIDFIRWIHGEFYKDAPEEMKHIHGAGRNFIMQPGEWRTEAQHDVVVGRHHPPSSHRIADFMHYFEQRYRFANQGKAKRILMIPAAHHRFNYIHPFPDGNGRVSRLMSHAMAHAAGIGAHGLWSISRGLARGLNSRREYKDMMDYADMPRQGDLDGRGNLSHRALEDFTLWFLQICLDQVIFMSKLFELDTLIHRFRLYMKHHERLKFETIYLLEEALIRGEVERGAISRITNLPERTARRVLSDAIGSGLLTSETPKGPLAISFPTDALETLFPKLFPEI